MSFELQRKIEKMWFEYAMKKRQIVAHINYQRYIEKKHIIKHILKFSPPSFSEVIRLKEHFVRVSQDKAGDKNLWYFYDDF